jgi:hypothetical protein
MCGGRAAWLSSSLALTLVCGCAGTFGGEPSYPDAAWAAGIQGDVTLELCPDSTRVLSGPPELRSAALDATRSRPPPSECHQARFAFRRSPSSAELLELTGQKGTILVTRGFERPSRWSCPSGVPFSEAMVSGKSVAVLTIDESGHVTGVVLRESVGGVNEERWVEQLRGCAFSPASFQGKAVPSHWVSAVQWEP